MKNSRKMIDGRKIFARKNWWKFLLAFMLSLFVHGLIYALLNLGTPNFPGPNPLSFMLVDLQLLALYVLLYVLLPIIKLLDLTRGFYDTGNPLSIDRSISVIPFWGGFVIIYVLMVFLVFIGTDFAQSRTSK